MKQLGLHLFLGSSLFLSNPVSAATRDYEDISFQLSDGTKITGKLLRIGSPKKGERLPLTLLFGGFQRAADVLTLIHPKQPTLVASFDYPFNSSRKLKFPQMLLYAKEARDMIHNTLEGIGVFVKILTQRADVNPDQVGIIGASLGAPFAVYSGGEFREFKEIMIVQGFGEIPQTIEHQFMRLWKPKWGQWARPLAWFLSRLAWLSLWIPSPEEQAKNYHPDQNVLLIEAQADKYIPTSAKVSLKKAFKSSNASIEVIKMSGKHLQPGDEKLIADILEKIVSWQQEIRSKK